MKNIVLIIPNIFKMFLISNYKLCQAPKLKIVKRIQVGRCLRCESPPHLFIAMAWSVWRIFPCMPTCNRHGEFTRRRHVEGGGGWRRWGCGCTLGAAAPRGSLPATAFCMVVCCWARSTAMPVVGLDWMGRWASLFICLFCAFLIAHFDSIPMYFLYVSYKTMIL
jgi:hypothetical protein